MPWIYEQSSGELFAPSGAHFASGYAGGNCGNNPEGVNNCTMQSIKKIGPLPVGLYYMRGPTDHPKLGPFAIPLEPDQDNEMFGRDGFYCHGDSIEHPGKASEGCIIMPRSVREAMWHSPDHSIQVVEKFNV